jgi:hypothetical protein
MKFDYDILFEFLPEEDKKSFIVWDNDAFSTGAAFCNPNGLDAKAAGVARIVVIYRAPFEQRAFIPLPEYELRLKQKVRDIKLEDILK